MRQGRRDFIVCKAIRSVWDFSLANAVSIVLMTMILTIIPIMIGCGSDPAGPGTGNSTTGSLDIKCLPSGLGAPWTLIHADQLVSVGYGDSLINDLPQGMQTLIWGMLPDWTKPQPDTLRISLLPDQTLSLTGHYGIIQSNKGKVRILPEPEGIEAPWSITGDNIFIFRGLGEQEVWLPQGDYTFAWGSITGYILPQGGPIPLTIKVGDAWDLRGLYRTGGSSAGTIIIDADPDSLRASWSLVDPEGGTCTGQGDAFLYGMPPGSYQLEWLPDPRWDVPKNSNPNGTLVAWNSLIFRGDYLSPEPLAVEGLDIDNGFVPGQVDISWHSIDDVIMPMIEYLVLALEDQDSVEPDWDEAMELGVFDQRGPGTIYHESFGPEANLIPGLPYRFTVRGRDTLNRLSPVRDSGVVTVGQGNRVSGILTDHRGRPLAGIPLEISFDGMTGNSMWVLTDEQGAFFGFSLWLGAVVHIRTYADDVDPGAWYDYVSDPLLDGTWQDMNLTLIPRRGVDESCPQYNGSFLTYVRTMTKTTNPTNSRPNTLLNKWDHFPLSVYIPDYVNGLGLDMGALCRTAPTTWNDDLDEVFYVFADAAQNADVVFRFGTDFPSVNGQVTILAPIGTHFIGDVIPQKMEVYIAADLSIAQRVQEVSLHELGHVLGIADHSLCNEAGYLMYISSAGVLNNGPENAIHPDEKALARCLRYLPQGVNMAGYE